MTFRSFLMFFVFVIFNHKKRCFYNRLLCLLSLVTIVTAIKTPSILPKHSQDTVTKQNVTVCDSCDKMEVNTTERA